MIKTYYCKGREEAPNKENQQHEHYINQFRRK